MSARVVLAQMLLLLTVALTISTLASLSPPTQPLHGPTQHASSLLASNSTIEISPPQQPPTRRRPHESQYSDVLTTSKQPMKTTQAVEMEFRDAPLIKDLSTIRLPWGSADLITPWDDSTTPSEHILAYTSLSNLTDEPDNVSYLRTETIFQADFKDEDAPTIVGGDTYTTIVLQSATVHEFTTVLTSDCRLSFFNSSESSATHEWIIDQTAINILNSPSIATNFLQFGQVFFPIPHATLRANGMLKSMLYMQCISKFAFTRSPSITDYPRMEQIHVVQQIYSTAGDNAPTNIGAPGTVPMTETNHFYGLTAELVYPYLLWSNYPKGSRGIYLVNAVNQFQLSLYGFFGAKGDVMRHPIENWTGTTDGAQASSFTFLTPDCASVSATTTPTTVDWFIQDDLLLASFWSQANFRAGSDHRPIQTDPSLMFPNSINDNQQDQDDQSAEKDHADNPSTTFTPQQTLPQCDYPLLSTAKKRYKMIDTITCFSEDGQTPLYELTMLPVFCGKYGTCPTTRGSTVQITFLQDIPENKLSPWSGKSRCLFALGVKHQFARNVDFVGGGVMNNFKNPLGPSMSYSLVFQPSSTRGYPTTLRVKNGLFSQTSSDTTFTFTLHTVDGTSPIKNFISTTGNLVAYTFMNFPLRWAEWDSVSTPFYYVCSNVADPALPNLNLRVVSWASHNVLSLQAGTSFDTMYATTTSIDFSCLFPNRSILRSVRYVNPSTSCPFCYRNLQFGYDYSSYVIVPSSTAIPTNPVPTTVTVTSANSYHFEVFFLDNNLAEVKFPVRPIQLKPQTIYYFGFYITGLEAYPHGSLTAPLTSFTVNFPMNIYINNIFEPGFLNTFQSACTARIGSGSIFSLAVQYRAQFNLLYVNLTPNIVFPPSMWLGQDTMVQCMGIPLILRFPTDFYASQPISPIALETGFFRNTGQQLLDSGFALTNPFTRRAYAPQQQRWDYPQHYYSWTFSPDHDITITPMAQIAKGVLSTVMFQIDRFNGYNAINQNKLRITFPGITFKPSVMQSKCWYILVRPTAGDILRALDSFLTVYPQEPSSIYLSADGADNTAVNIAGQATWYNGLNYFRCELSFVIETYEENRSQGIFQYGGPSSLLYFSDVPYTFSRGYKPVPPLPDPFELSVSVSLNYLDLTRDLSIGYGVAAPFVPILQYNVATTNAGEHYIFSPFSHFLTDNYCMNGTAIIATTFHVALPPEIIDQLLDGAEFLPFVNANGETVQLYADQLQTVIYVDFLPSDAPQYCSFASIVLNNVENASTKSIFVPTSRVEHFVSFDYPALQYLPPGSAVTVSKDTETLNLGVFNTQLTPDDYFHFFLYHDVQNEVDLTSDSTNYSLSMSSYAEFVATQQQADQVGGQNGEFQQLGQNRQKPRPHTPKFAKLMDKEALRRVPLSKLLERQRTLKGQSTTDQMQFDDDHKTTLQAISQFSSQQTDSTSTYVRNLIDRINPKTVISLKINESFGDSFSQHSFKIPSTLLNAPHSSHLAAFTSHVRGQDYGLMVFIPSLSMNSTGTADTKFEFEIHEPETIDNVSITYLTFFITSPVNIINIQIIADLFRSGLEPNAQNTCTLYYNISVMSNITENTESIPLDFYHNINSRYILTVRIPGLLPQRLHLIRCAMVSATLPDADFPITAVVAEAQSQTYATLKSTAQTTPLPPLDPVFFTNLDFTITGAYQLSNGSSVDPNNDLVLIIGDYLLAKLQNVTTEPFSLLDIQHLAYLVTGSRAGTSTFLDYSYSSESTGMSVQGAHSPFPPSPSKSSLGSFFEAQSQPNSPHYTTTRQRECMQEKMTSFEQHQFQSIFMQSGESRGATWFENESLGVFVDGVEYDSRLFRPQFFSTSDNKAIFTQFTPISPLDVFDAQQNHPMNAMKQLVEEVQNLDETNTQTSSTPANPMNVFIDKLKSYKTSDQHNISQIHKPTNSRPVKHEVQSSNPSNFSPQYTHQHSSTHHRQLSSMSPSSLIDEYFQHSSQNSIPLNSRNTFKESSMLTDPVVSTQQVYSTPHQKSTANTIIATAMLFNATLQIRVPTSLTPDSINALFYTPNVDPTKPPVQNPVLYDSLYYSISFQLLTPAENIQDEKNCYQNDWCGHSCFELCAEGIKCRTDFDCASRYCNKNLPAGIARCTERSNRDIFLSYQPSK